MLIVSEEDQANSTLLVVHVYTCMRSEAVFVDDPPPVQRRLRSESACSLSCSRSQKRLLRVESNTQFYWRIVFVEVRDCKKQVNESVDRLLLVNDVATFFVVSRERYELIVLRR
jgi:hypothetical protein